MSTAQLEQSEASQLIEDTADRILREQCTKELVDAAEQGSWPAQLWQTLETAGLPWAAAAERLGGAGLTLPEALGLLRLVGKHAVPAPLAETLIASALLSEDEQLQALPEGPLALVVAGPEETITRPDGGLQGELREVPFVPVASQLVVAWEEGGRLQLGLVAPDAVARDDYNSIAGEPQACITLAGVQPAQQAQPVSVTSLEALQGVMALSRALMIAGGLQSTLDMSVAYALERRQFGREIAKFQAVQQQLAVLASDTAAAIRASSGALEAFNSADMLREAAVAKARAGEAAGRGAEIAHQVHGAMGFTYEHRLHHRSRRLWAWRDQYGHEAYWQAWLGRQLCAAGADEVWPLITQVAP